MQRFLFPRTTKVILQRTSIARYYNNSAGTYHHPPSGKVHMLAGIRGYKTVPEPRKVEPHAPIG